MPSIAQYIAPNLYEAIRKGAAHKRINVGRYVNELLIAGIESISPDKGSTKVNVKGVPVPVYKIRAELEKEKRLCPNCLKYIIVPGTNAAKNYGVCEVCYKKAANEAYEQEIARLKEVKVNTMERQRLSRMRIKLNELDPDNYRRGSEKPKSNFYSNLNL